MRILVQLAAPGHLRITGGILEELVHRGHDVLLAYDSHDPDEDVDTVTDAHSFVPGVERVEPLPRARALRERSAVRDLRLLADFLRYDAPAFHDAPYLQGRMAKYVARRRGVVRRLQAVRLSRGFVALEPLLERLIPVDPAVVATLASHRPDVAVVSPLIARGRNGVQQTETVKACRALGVPVVALISSWDHLTSKGIIKVIPDRVLVWNEAQAAEARLFHRVPRERIAVTGAGLFDRWFDRTPAVSREEFLRGLGLPSDRPCVLYVGSSPNITPPELEIPFVQTWLRALRGADDARVATASVVIRPHPGTVAAWADDALADAQAVAVAPRMRPSMPMSRDDDDLYFHSIHHADAVVGINTSAILEAFVQRKPVLTVRAPEFAATQTGTLHYRHLTPAGGGPLQEASTLGEHVRQLAEALADPARTRVPIDAFVRSFLRPHGLDRPATPIAADAVEALARPVG